MKKYRYFAIGLLIFAAVICSFWLPRRNLRATAQVAGIALDWVEEGMMATFEIYEGDADENIGTQKQVAFGYGNTFEECIQNTLRGYGKHLFVNDASALFLGDEKTELLLGSVLEYYKKFAHDDMDLPVFFSKGRAADLLMGEGGVRSVEIAASAKLLHRRQTIKELMNQRGERIYLKLKENGYELEE